MKKKLIALSLLAFLSACADENTENALLKQRVNMLTQQNAEQQDRIKTLEMMLAQAAPVAVATQAAAPVVVQDHAAATAAAAAVQGAAVVAAQQAAAQMEMAQMRDELAQAQIQAAQAQAAANQAAAQAQAAGGSGLGTLAMGAAAGVAGKYAYDKYKENKATTAPSTTTATAPKTGSVIAPSAAKPAAAATPNYRPTTQGYAMTKQPSTVSAAATAPTKSFGSLNAQGVKPSSVTLNKPITTTTTPSYRPTTSGYSNISKPSVSRPAARGR